MKYLKRHLITIISILIPITFTHIYFLKEENEKTNIVIKKLDGAQFFIHNSASSVNNAFMEIIPFNTEETEKALQLKRRYCLTALINVSNQLRPLIDDNNFVSRISGFTRRDLAYSLTNVQFQLSKDFRSISENEIQEIINKLRNQAYCLELEIKYQKGKITKLELNDLINETLYPHYPKMSQIYDPDLDEYILREERNF